MLNKKKKIKKITVPTAKTIVKRNLAGAVVKGKPRPFTMKPPYKTVVKAAPVSFSTVTRSETARRVRMNGTEDWEAATVYTAYTPNSVQDGYNLTIETMALPRLSTFAALYQMWRPIRLRFEYRSIMPTGTGGDIFLAFIPDVADLFVPGTTSCTTYLTQLKFVESSVWQNAALELNIGDFPNLSDWYYTTPQGTDSRLSGPGSFVYGYYGPPVGADTIMGDITIFWDVEFDKLQPITVTPGVSPVLGDKVVAGIGSAVSSAQPIMSTVAQLIQGISGKDVQVTCSALKGFGIQLPNEIGTMFNTSFTMFGNYASDASDIIITFGMAWAAYDAFSQKYIDLTDASWMGDIYGNISLGNWSIMGTTIGVIQVAGTLAYGGGQIQYNSEDALWCKTTRPGLYWVPLYYPSSALTNVWYKFLVQPIATLPALPGSCAPKLPVLPSIPSTPATTVKCQLPVSSSLVSRVR